MVQEQSNSLVNLGDLGKPANTLIEKISAAVGGIFAPYQTKRLATAEAEAALIRARSDIQVTDLYGRAVHRWIEEEAQRQKNIEGITAKALPLLNSNSNAGGVADDWVVNFFDKSRIVSDEHMQSLWSRILAGEANAPGTYSKRTVNFLSSLDKPEAQLFTKLCGFAWVLDEPVPLIFDVEAKIYNSHGIDFVSLSHLDSIGLAKFNAITGFARQNLPKTYVVHYNGRPLDLNWRKDTKNSLSLGHVMLTQIGQELAPICGSKPVDGLWEYVKGQWKSHLRSPGTQ